MCPSNAVHPSSDKPMRWSIYVNQSNCARWLLINITFSLPSPLCRAYTVRAFSTRDRFGPAWFSDACLHRDERPDHCGNKKPVHPAMIPQDLQHMSWNLAVFKVVFAITPTIDRETLKTIAIAVCNPTPTFHFFRVNMLLHLETTINWIHGHRAVFEVLIHLIRGRNATWSANSNSTSTTDSNHRNNKTTLEKS